MQDELNTPHQANEPEKCADDTWMTTPLACCQTAAFHLGRLCNKLRDHAHRAAVFIAMMDDELARQEDAAVHGVLDAILATAQRFSDEQRTTLISTEHSFRTAWRAAYTSDNHDRLESMAWRCERGREPALADSFLEELMGKSSNYLADAFERALTEDKRPLFRLGHILDQGIRPLNALGLELAHHLSHRPFDPSVAILAWRCDLQRAFENGQPELLEILLNVPPGEPVGQVVGQLDQAIRRECRATGVRDDNHHAPTSAAIGHGEAGQIAQELPPRETEFLEDTESKAPDPKPSWDARTGKLWFNGEIAREVATQARDVRMLLDLFAASDWQKTVYLTDQQFKDKRADVMKSANQNLKGLSFHGDGLGTGIEWRLVDSSGESSQQTSG